MEKSALLQLAPQDNVLVLIRSVDVGDSLLVGSSTVIIKQSLTLGHKIAARHISAGEKIIKYGAPIGSATQDIHLGDHVHQHNMESNYIPTYRPEQEQSNVRLT